MSIVRLDPVSLLRDFDRLFDRSALAQVDTADWSPRLDVAERDDSLLIRAELPGIDPGNVDITVDGRRLTIKGSRSFTTEDDENGYQRREIFEGSFRRSIRLSYAADPETITASADNGILEIVVPRQEKASPHKIPVTVN